MGKAIVIAITLACILCSHVTSAKPDEAGTQAQFAHELLWFHDNKLTLSGLELLSLMADIGMRESPQLSPSEWANTRDTDNALTQGLLTINKIVIGHQVKVAALTPALIHSAWHDDRLGELIDNQLPRFPEIVALRRAISQMRELSQIPWPVIPENFTPRLGQRHKHVAALIEILVRLGDFSVSDPRLLNDFTPQVQRAIKNFQRRHGLAVSGKLDRPTREKLAWTPPERLTVLQYNLYRWLSLPAVPPQRYILVNIPSYQLTLWENGQPTLAMPIVVGKPETPTPIMLTEIDRVTANPQWVPPASIVRGELLTQIARSPGLMASQNFHWVSRTNRHHRLPLKAGLDDAASLYRTHMLVQGPGQSNALGKWRFNIKNNEAIYLHDTPVKHLFSAPVRAFSHGCIRLAAPEKLAHKLLETTGITPATADTVHTRLAEPVPTYINYQTVEINEGEIQWLHDIYAQDSPQFYTSASQHHATQRN